MVRGFYNCLQLFTSNAANKKYVDRTAGPYLLRRASLGGEREILKRFEFVEEAVKRREFHICPHFHPCPHSGPRLPRR